MSDLDELDEFDELLQQPAPISDDGSDLGEFNILSQPIPLEPDDWESSSASSSGYLETDAGESFRKAAVENNIQHVCFLLACGDNPAADNEGTSSPLQLAALNDSTDAVLIMLATRRNVIGSDPIGSSILASSIESALDQLDNQDTRARIDEQLRAFAESGDSSEAAHLRLIHAAAVDDDWRFVCSIVYHYAGKGFDLSEPLRETTGGGRTPLAAAWAANPSYTMTIQVLLAARADPFSNAPDSFDEIVMATDSEEAAAVSQHLIDMHYYMYGSENEPSNLTDPGLAVDWLIHYSGVDWKNGSHLGSSSVQSALQALKLVSLQALVVELLDSREVVANAIGLDALRALCGELVCYTAMMDDKAAAHPLLAARADCNWCDHSGRSALSYAAANDNPDLIFGLVHAGAYFNRLDHQNLSALGTACQERHPRSARALLEVRANVDGAYNQETHTTPLMLACDSGAAECVALLLEHGAVYHIYLVDVPAAGLTPTQLK